MRALTQRPSPAGRLRCHRPTVAKSGLPSLCTEPWHALARARARPRVRPHWEDAESTLSPAAAVPAVPIPAEATRPALEHRSPGNRVGAVAYSGQADDLCDDGDCKKRPCSFENAGRENSFSASDTSSWTGWADRARGEVKAFVRAAAVAVVVDEGLYVFQVINACYSGGNLLQCPDTDVDLGTVLENASMRTRRAGASRVPATRRSRSELDSFGWPTDADGRIVDGAGVVEGDRF
ncbi:hypothetical protein BIW11_13995 [Tropilaelaps mercedesae]|uniref:Uncharacterized protein n=1 Tax=Tropilaelaps mercedesae TaxID=418985 RepID=A0A1V9WZY9_9ACAR|nr:hypothetical protein BIW11_13995 [Tropilaelaps mercedesae]